MKRKRSDKTKRRLEWGAYESEFEKEFLEAMYEIEKEQEDREEWEKRDNPEEYYKELQKTRKIRKRRGIRAVIFIIIAISFIILEITTINLKPQKLKNGELPYVSQNIELNTEIKDKIQKRTRYSVNKEYAGIPSERNEYHFEVEKEGILSYDGDIFLSNDSYYVEILNEKTGEIDVFAHEVEEGMPEGKPVKPGKYTLYIYQSPFLEIFGRPFKKSIKFTLKFYEGVPKEFKKGINNLPEGTTNENYTIRFYEDKSYPYIGETTKPRN